MEDDRGVNEDHDFLIEENERLHAEIDRLRIELGQAKGGLPVTLLDASENVKNAYLLLAAARERGDQPHAIVVPSGKAREYDGRMLVDARMAGVLVRHDVARWHRYGEAPEGLPHGLYLIES